MHAFFSLDVTTQLVVAVCTPSSVSFQLEKCNSMFPFCFKITFIYIYMIKVTYVYNKSNLQI
jgi:hypothetical protein